MAVPLRGRTRICKVAPHQGGLVAQKSGRKASGRSTVPRWTLLASGFGLAGMLAGCSSAVGPALTAPGGPTAVLAVDQSEAGALVSDYRKTRGLAPVAVDPVLQRVAQAQADAMASADQLSHTVDGALPERLGRVGRGRAASVENVSAGYPSLQAALAGWRRSAPHNANLLYGPVRRIGVAAANAPGTRYRTFWALVMTN